MNLPVKKANCQLYLVQIIETIICALCHFNHLSNCSFDINQSSLVLPKKLKILLVTDFNLLFQVEIIYKGFHSYRISTWYLLLKSLELTVFHLEFSLCARILLPSFSP